MLAVEVEAVEASPKVDNISSFHFAQQSRLACRQSAAQIQANMHTNANPNANTNTNTKNPGEGVDFNMDKFYIVWQRVTKS